MQPVFSRLRWYTKRFEGTRTTLGTFYQKFNLRFPRNESTAAVTEWVDDTVYNVLFLGKETAPTTPWNPYVEFARNPMSNDIKITKVKWLDVETVFDQREVAHQWENYRRRLRSDSSETEKEALRYFDVALKDPLPAININTIVGNQTFINELTGSEHIPRQAVALLHLRDFADILDERLAVATASSSASSNWIDVLTHLRDISRNKVYFVYGKKFPQPPSSNTFWTAYMAPQRDVPLEMNTPLMATLVWMLSSLLLVNEALLPKMPVGTESVARWRRYLYETFIKWDNDMQDGLPVHSIEYLTIPQQGVQRDWKLIGVFKH
jgi:hypothetical protein